MQNTGADGTGGSGAPPPMRPERPSWWRRAARRLRAAREIYEGVFIAPYRSQVYREFRRERDLFFLIGFADLLGVPSPLAFYTLELYPDLIEQFHEWHLRMGLDTPPEGGFRCC